MILSTLNTLPQGSDYKIQGIVFSDVCMGANFIKDAFASIGDKIGGRITSYEKVVGSARKKAVEEMVKDAEKIGADAIIGVEFDIISLGDKNTIIQMIAKGTAVKLS